MTTRAAMRLVLTCMLLAPAASHAESFERALEGLLESSPRITAAERNLEATEKSVDEAFAGFLPRVSATGDAGYEITDSPGRRLLGQGDLETSRESLTLSATQNLFDGYRTTATSDVAKLNSSAAARSLEAVTQQVLLQGANAYHNVLRNERLVALAKASEETIARQLELEDERVRRGGGVAVDVLLSKSRLQRAKEQRVAFQGALREAAAVYQQVFDQPPVPRQMNEPVPPMDMLPSSLPEAIERALEENPEIAANDLLTEASGRQREVAKGEYYPTIDLVAEGGYENNVEGTLGVRRDAALLLRFTWEIFSGFATRARAAQAGARYSESLANLTQSKRQVAENVRIAWERLQTATERVQLLQNAVNIASELFEARKRLREAGKETAVNVLDAETELYSAQIVFANASYDARLAAYAVLQAVGRLSPAALGLAES